MIDLTQAFASDAVFVLVIQVIAVIVFLVIPFIVASCLYLSFPKDENAKEFLGQQKWRILGSIGGFILAFFTMVVFVIQILV